MGADARARLADERGFTLVELLVVTILLGLLVAIAMPSFLTQREKARDADAKSVARTAALAIEAYATEGNGDYDGATIVRLGELEPALTGSSLAVNTATGPAYEIAVTSGTGNVFTVERRADGTSRLACTAPGSAGCPADGRWD